VIMIRLKCDDVRWPGQYKPRRSSPVSGQCIRTCVSALKRSAQMHSTTILILVSFFRKTIPDQLGILPSTWHTTRCTLSSILIQHKSVAGPGIGGAGVRYKIIGSVDDWVISHISSCFGPVSINISYNESRANKKLKTFTVLRLKKS